MISSFMQWIRRLLARHARSEAIVGTSRLDRLCWVLGVEADEGARTEFARVDRVVAVGRGAASRLRCTGDGTTAVERWAARVGQTLDDHVGEQGYVVRAALRWRPDSTEALRDAIDEAERALERALNAERALARCAEGRAALDSVRGRFERVLPAGWGAFYGNGEVERQLSQAVSVGRFDAILLQIEQGRCLMESRVESLTHRRQRFLEILGSGAAEADGAGHDIEADVRSLAEQVRRQSRRLYEGAGLRIDAACELHLRHLGNARPGRKSSGSARVTTRESAARWNQLRRRRPVMRRVDCSDG